MSTSFAKRDGGAPPNILFIMADDHASKAISAYGHGINNTPNIDRIAKEGARLDHCYVTNSICTPSRATILTGVHNHLNMVHTLACSINNRMPNVAKHLRAYGDYTTCMIGKWHLGEGKDHEPKGFDHWDVLHQQGEYHDTVFIDKECGTYRAEGYTTDIITDKTIGFLKSEGSKSQAERKPFFLMCHHKAPHSPWRYHPRHENLYKDPIKVPHTYLDDYENRAMAAAAATNKIAIDLTYTALGLAQPEGGKEIGILQVWGSAGGQVGSNDQRKVPSRVADLPGGCLICIRTGEKFTFKDDMELRMWKYQRYMQRYLRTVQAVDDGVGQILDYLEESGLAENTMVIYTSDQGFFLGDHGWHDKRFMYEESFQMPFLVKGPGIAPGIVIDDIVSNVDFAPTWLELAGLAKPAYMQGDSFLPVLQGRSRPQGPDAVAYHRYWMHRERSENCYAHYGIRDRRWKLIFWYNAGLNLDACEPGGEEQEWELFDCQEDPMELFNLWNQESSDLNAVRERMVRLLEAKMMEIADEPEHPVGLSSDELRRRYPGVKGLARISGQHNMATDDD